MLTKYKEVAGEDWHNWRWQLKNQIRHPTDLAAMLRLPQETLSDIARVNARYPLRITPYYLSLAETASLDDPILRQCLPNLAELDEDNGGAPDALDEQGSSPLPNLVHRYPDRALFITGNFCAVHCRHCMRKRHWEAQMLPPSSAEIEAVATYLENHAGVREVLISGGDPLLLSEGKLEEIIQSFSAVSSLQTLRFGSRVPTVLPQRMTTEFCRLLASGKPAWLATHFNHARELTAEAAKAADNLLRAGIPVVNQSVLLKGVNDSVEALGDLFTGLLRLKIKPYYLFHGDPIQGTMHFRTGVEKGLEILDALRGKISGLALPAYAFDLPGGAGKIRLEPNVRLGKNAQGSTVYRSYQGLEIPYQ
jgi:lysine 2,3-aminomutase